MPMSPQKEIKFAKKLVRLLAKKRSDPYETWSKVGLCLGHIDKSLWKDWIEFSKRTPHKFNREETPGLMKNLFRKGQEYGVTIGSLIHWAREDSPAEYAALVHKFNMDDTDDDLIYKRCL